MHHKVALLTQAHFMRFENFENFPKLYSNNRKITRDFNFCKHSGREKALHDDPSPTPYDVNFNQRFRKVTSTLLNNGLIRVDKKAMSTGFQ